MSKEKAPASAWWHGWFQTGLYKRNQGRIVRQATFATLAVAILIAAWRFYDTYADSGTTAYVGSALIAVIGLWLSFRAVNFPRFADFLIAVEAEMGKVSWPTRKELFRGSVVVIVTIVALGLILVFFDLLWSSVLSGLSFILSKIFG